MVSEVMDFVAYWAASRILLTGGNPYSIETVFALQKSIGLQAATPLLMWNPPWTLSFILPFGSVDFATSQFLWLVVSIFIILLSAVKLWQIYGNPPQSRKPWLLAFTFAPTLFVLVFGQISPIILLGLTAFLYFEQKQNWAGAGLALALLSIKPHFVYLFWIALSLWIWQRRQWRILLVAAVAWIIAAAIPLLFDPTIYSQYLEVLQTTTLPTPLELPAPTLRNALRSFAAIHSPIAGNLPTFIGVVWIVIFWFRNRVDWQWAERLPLILLVSLTTTAYTWTFDQVALLPALIQGATWLGARKLGWRRWIGVAIYCAINSTYLVAKLFIVIDAPYF